MKNTCNVLNENVSNVDENDENFKLFYFSKILCIFPYFRQTLSIGTSKRVNKEKMCCPVGSSQEFFVVFEVKMSQIDTEIDKNPKTSNFQGFMLFSSKFLSDFVN